MIELLLIRYFTLLMVILLFNSQLGMFET